MNQSISILALAAAALLGSCRNTGDVTDVPIYTVEGAVARSGEFLFEDDLTLWEAVMLAEPVEARCDLGRVELRREGDGEPQLFTVDVNRIIETGDTTFNVLIHEGGCDPGAGESRGVSMRGFPAVTGAHRRGHSVVEEVNPARAAGM